MQSFQEFSHLQLLQQKLSDLLFHDPDSLSCVCFPTGTYIQLNSKQPVNVEDAILKSVWVKVQKLMKDTSKKLS